MVAIFTGAGAGFERGSASVLGGSGLLGSGVRGRSGEAVSVNAANGNLLISRQDEFLVGMGPDVGVGQTYNGLPTVNENGDCWRFSYDRRVFGLTGTENASGSTIKRLSGDGSEITYSWDSSKSAYVTTDGGGTFDTIRKVGSHWEWTDGDSRIVEKYEAHTYADSSTAYRLIEQRDIDGNKLTFSYNSGSDQLHRISTQDGAWVEYEWASGNVTKLTTGQGTTTTLSRTYYGYDTSNRLTTVTTDLEISTAAHATSITDNKVYTTTYTYYSGGSFDGRIHTISQTDGSLLTITYNGDGKIKDLTQTVGPNDTRVTQFLYGQTDANGIYTAVTAPNGQITRLYHDTVGNLARVVSPPAASGAAEQHVQFNYDGSGNLTSAVDARGETSSYEYDIWGNVTKSTDRETNVVDRTYGTDGRNLLLTESWIASDSNGASVTQTRRYVYDDEGHLRYIISPEGRVDEYQYYANGTLRSIVAYPEHEYPAGTTAPVESAVNSWVYELVAGPGGLTSIIKTYFTYDARGGLLTRADYGLATTGGDGATSEGYTYTSTVFDQAGLLTSRKLYDDNAETYGYDGLRRMTAKTDTNGAVTTIAFTDATTTTVMTYGPTNLVMTSIYNKAGDLVSYAEIAAHVTAGTATYSYDKLGRVRVASDATGKKSYSHYDAAGRLVATIDGAGRITEYRYDAGNRLISQVSYATATPVALSDLDIPDNIKTIADLRPAAHPDDQWSWWVHDDEGRVLRAIEGDGSVTAYAYDAAGQLTNVTSFYTKLGETALAGFRSASSSTDWPTVATATPTADSARDSIVRNFYDSDGRLLAVLDGEGYLATSTYNKAGALVEARAYTNKATNISGTLDAVLSSVTASTANDRFAHYVRDGRGLLRYIVDGANQVTEQVYDNAGRQTTTHVYAYPLGTTTDYTYDSVEALLLTAYNAASSAVRAQTRSTHVVYNLSGQVDYSFDAEGYVTFHKYNAAGQEIRTQRYPGQWPYSWLPSSVGSEFQTWLATQVSDANVRTNRTWYNERGDAIYTLDAENFVSRMTYDAEGRVLTTERWENSVTISGSSTLAQLATASSGWGTKRTTSIGYDTAGRVDTVTDSGDVVTKSLYYANGLLKGTIAAFDTIDAVETRLVYDKAGRVISSSTILSPTESVTTATEYDGLGNVTKVIDARNNATTFTHDRLGRVKTTTDALSGLTQYGYNAFGEVETVTDARNKITTSAYDKLGRLISVTDALDQETRFEYTRFGEIWKVTDPRLDVSYSWYDKLGRMTVSLDAGGYITGTSYTAFGEVASVTRYFAVHSATGLTAAAPPAITPTSGEDATTWFKYDRRGRLRASADAYGVIDLAQPSDHTEHFAYNGFGERISSTNKAGATTNYAYNARGQLITITGPAILLQTATGTETASVVTKYEYDLRGNARKTTEAFGRDEARVTQFTYDKLNRLIKTTHQAVDAITGGDPLVAASPVTPEEHIKYDAAGNFIETIGANGARTLHYYDALGRRIVTIDALGGYSKWTYDEVGNVKTEVRYETSVTLPTVAGGTTPAAPTTGSSRTTRFDYDDVGRLTHRHVDNVFHGMWDGTTYTTGTSTATVVMTYDANGNVVKTTDANGEVIHAWYDALSRKTDELDAEGYLAKWAFDSDGNVTSERRYATQWTGSISLSAPPSVGTATSDRVTDFAYNLLGQRLTETRKTVVYYSVDSGGVLSSASTGDATITYTYNALGQVLTRTEAAGDAFTYNYDATGRLTSESRASFVDFNNATVTPTTSYNYDGLGNLKSSVQAGYGTTEARTTSYSYSTGGRLASMTDAEGFTRTYAYDAAGQLRKESYTRSTSGATAITQVTDAIVTQYDLLGRTIYEGVAAWQTTTSSFALLDWSETGYNHFGEAVSSSVHGLTQTLNLYDNAGRLWATTAGDGIAKLFVYDRNGNQTATIVNAGTDLSSYAAQSAATGLANALGQASSETVNATWTRYDKRNMAVSSREEGRRLIAGTTGSEIVNIDAARSYTAFGEVHTETDAFTNVTTHSYNAMGRLIRSESPLVSITTENGTLQTVRPTIDNYFDRSGRLVATRDANGTYNTQGEKTADTGNRTIRRLLAGTGYQGSTALVVEEIHADGGRALVGYDIHGDARKVTNEVGRVTDQQFDAMGRVTQITRPGGLVESYVYDSLGQRTQHYTSFAPTNIARTEYDALGRVTIQIAFGGDTTTTGYAWESGIATAGVGTFGGWKEDVTYANGKTSIAKSDIFGRATTKTDMGNHTTNYEYDVAGRMTSSISDLTLTTAFEWFNTGLLAKNTGPFGLATYGYDKAGRRTSEALVNGGVSVKNSVADYDALGRITRFEELATGTAASPAAKVLYSYDANGNIRKTVQTYAAVASDGTIIPAINPTTYFFLFDSMNRLVLDKGSLKDNAITRGDVGTSIVYDKDGSRKASMKTVYTPFDYGTGGFYQEVRDNYLYNAAGQLGEIQVSRGQTALPVYVDYAATPPANLPAAPDSGPTRSEFTYDLLGRVTIQIDKSTYSDKSAFDRRVEYNNKGQMTKETTISLRASDLFKSETLYDYTDIHGYALGGVTKATTANWKKAASSTGNFQSQTGTSTANEYQWYDGAVQSKIIYDNDTSPSSSNASWISTYNLNGVGQLTSVTIDDERDRTVTFTNDENGQIVKRQEADNTSAGDPLEFWYRFNGRQWGMTGNNGTDKVGYETSIDERQTPQPPTIGPFRNGASNGTYHNDFTQSYDPINSYSQGSTGGSYTVRAGDTLQGIALAVWGDANLWYKIAEANGLSAGAALIDGQSLILPSGINTSAYNADTLKPYDPQDAIGDTSPTAPKPPKKNKCAVVGQLFIAVISIAVTHILGPLAGNITTQGLNNLFGYQNGFDFKSLAMTAIHSLLAAPPTGNPLIDAAAAAYSNAQAQGIGMVLGLQDKFSWSSVAAAGVSAGVSSGLSNHLGTTQKGFTRSGSLINNDGAARILSSGARIAVGGATILASAATRSALGGGNFGDNIMAGLPSVLAQIGAAGLSGFGGLQGTRGVVGNSPVDKSGGYRNSLREMPVDLGASGPVGISSDDFAELEAQILQNAINDGDILLNGAPTLRGRARVTVEDGPAEIFAPPLAMAPYRGPPTLAQIDQYRAQALAGNTLARQSYGADAENFASYMAYLDSQRAQRLAEQNTLTIGTDDISHVLFGGPVSGVERYLQQGTGFAVRPLDLSFDCNGGRRQYMRGDGSVVRATPTEMMQRNQAVRDVRSIERLTGGFAAGTSYGIALSAGADDATLDLVHGVGSSVDGAILGAGGMAGAPSTRYLGNQLTMAANGPSAIYAAERGAGRTNFNVYEVLTEQSITGTGRSAHRISANKALYKDLQANPEIAQMLNHELGADVFSHMGSGSGRNLLNPPGAVWHHPIENPSVMRLLRTSEHNNPLLQPVLHPGPNRTGGFGTHFGGN